MKKRPRFFQWFYAFIHGYFWLPCPICGEKFGGHEKGHSIYTGEAGGVSPAMPTGGTMVCQDCIIEAKKRNYNRYGYV